MTGDQLYDLVKQILRENRPLERFYWIAKLMIRIHLQEPTHQPTVFRWKKTA